MLTHDEIARRAYQLFETRGSSHGRDLDDWFLAERELQSMEQHLVLFFPFLRMTDRHVVAGIEFVPLRDGDDKVFDQVASAAAPLTKILSGYIDRHGKPFTNCVIATIPGRGWDLTKDDFSAVRWAASLLFLASWACNEYLAAQGIGSYVNSTAFRVVGQGYKGKMPDYIAISNRRRDGEGMDGGYKHGEFKFSIPLQSSIRDTADVDAAFLKSLDAASSADSETIRRLRTSLPFVELGNTDDNLMTLHAEAILMGSAFEQLLNADGSADLSRRFATLFNGYGSVTVAKAQETRSDIKIKTYSSYPEWTADEQGRWPVHRKWIEELYDLRSKMVHKGGHEGRKWAWTPFEHLIIAAFTFPLVVKLKLAQEGFYEPTEDDQANCIALDKLLASTSWWQQDDADNAGPSWRKIISKTKWDRSSERIFAKLKAEHPEIFEGDPAESENG